MLQAVLQLGSLDGGQNGELQIGHLRRLLLRLLLLLLCFCVYLHAA